MKENIGNIDATVRFLVAFAFFYLGLYYLDGIDGDLLGLITSFSSFGMIWIATSRYCPLWNVLNIDTRKTTTEN